MFQVLMFQQFLQGPTLCATVMRSCRSYELFKNKKCQRPWQCSKDQSLSQRVSRMRLFAPLNSNSRGLPYLLGTPTRRSRAPACPHTLLVGGERGVPLPPGSFCTSVGTSRGCAGAALTIEPVSTTIPGLPRWSLAAPLHAIQPAVLQGGRRARVVLA